MVLYRKGMGLWSEWYYTTSKIVDGYNKHDPVRAGDYVAIHRSPSLSTNIAFYDSFITSRKYCLPAAGFMSRLLLWCFEFCAHAAVARAAIFIVKFSKCVNEIMFKCKMKSWTVTGVIMWLCVNMAASKEAQIEFCRQFHPFIQQHNADVVHRRSLRGPDHADVTPL